MHVRPATLSRLFCGAEIHPTHTGYTIYMKFVDPALGKDSVVYLISEHELREKVSLPPEDVKALKLLYEAQVEF